jgi:hypothetical protein
MLYGNSQFNPILSYKFSVTISNESTSMTSVKGGHTVFDGEVPFHCCRISGLSSETTIMKVNQVTSPLIRFIPTHVTYGNVTFEQGVFDYAKTLTDAEIVRFLANADMDLRPLYKIEIRTYTKAARGLSKGQADDLRRSHNRGVKKELRDEDIYKENDPFLDFKGVTLRGCFPIKFSYSDLDAMESKIWFNTIEFAVSSMEIGISYNASAIPGQKDTKQDITDMVI